MKKKWVLSLLSMSVVLGAATYANASDAIRVLVNGQPLKSDVQPVVENSRVLVPLRAVSDSLGAVVSYDSSTRTVKVDMPNSQSEQQRIQFLEQALAPNSPGEAATRFAEGVLTRNGALQFAVLSADLRSLRKASYEAWNWHPGASSTINVSYEVKNGQQIDSNTWSYDIFFKRTDGSTSSPLTVKLAYDGQHWFVSDTGDYGK